MHFFSTCLRKARSVARHFLGFGGQGGTFLRGSDDDHQPAGTVGVFLSWEVGGSFAIGAIAERKLSET
jgi:hypothetical protein